MLVEKAGKFDLKSFNMRNWPIMPSRIHKYDFSDSAVIKKVKNRRPKDSLTPQQVAALTSVAIRYQPSALLYSHQIQSSHIWIDDYSHQKMHFNTSRHHLSLQPSMPYQRQNSNQCELYTNQIKFLLSTYIETKNNGIINKEIKTIPILQRLFEAQRLQQYEQKRINSLQITDIDTFIQLINEHLKYSTTMEASTTPSINITGSNNDTHHSKEDDDKQNFYSIPPSFIE
ncbi:unnamed protein product [Rotaria sordida]|uniref:Uncharacterized protein n=1 Tax=Rotaria sordida TaxID=392033 RepID=A0A814V4K3_9BILA|nr:unnamed protein product [Rotaria sordida]